MDLDPYLRYESLIVREAASGVLWLAMRQDMLPRAHDEIGRIFLDVDRDPDVRVVLVGGDDEHGEPNLLDFMRQITEDWDLRMAVMREASALVNNIINCSKPVVSLLPGAVTPVALVSDVTIASRSAVIIDAHASYGAVTGDHAVLLGPSFAVWPRPSTTSSWPSRSPVRRPSGSGWSRSVLTTTTFSKKGSRSVSAWPQRLNGPSAGQRAH